MSAVAAVSKSVVERIWSGLAANLSSAAMARRPVRVIGDLLNPMASSVVSTRFVFFQLYASHRDDMGQANFMATQNLESLTSSMKTPTYPPMKVASHSL